MICGAQLEFMEKDTFLNKSRLKKFRVFSHTLHSNHFISSVLSVNKSCCITSLFALFTNVLSTVYAGFMVSEGAREVFDEIRSPFLRRETAGARKIT